MFRAMSCTWSCTCAVAIALALGLYAGPAAHAQGTPALQAASPRGGDECLSRQEQRIAVNQGRAVRLGEALRSIHARSGDELLRVELCQRGNGLVYVLTIFSRNGKVSRAVIDARSGAVVKDR